MVIHLNNKKLIVLLFSVLTVCILCAGGSKMMKRQVLARFPVCDKTIIIDAGHGGLDGGAVSKDGSYEKEINLNIAKYLESYLKQSGARVIMTRSTDKSLHKDEGATVNEKKKSDLLTRKSKVNESGADLFISIHQNYFTQSQYKGAQVFYDGKSPLSQKCALIIQTSIKDNADNDNMRVPMEIDKSKMLFSDLKVPAVLVECGFLSNPEEAVKLKTKEYQQKIAFSIYLGIIQYFDKAER